MPKTSARASTSPPSICSGAMCAGLPRTWPVDVTPCASSSFAMPKSVSLTTTRSPLGGGGRAPLRGQARRSGRCSSRTFSGLMSRWTTPRGVGVRQRREELEREGRGDLGRHRARASAAACAASSRAGAPPTRYCSRSSASLTSNTSTMFGCRSLATACASVLNRETTSFESRRCGWMTFTATSRPRRLSRARYTVAIPPWPISSRTSYLASWGSLDRASGARLHRVLSVSGRLPPLRPRRFRRLRSVLSLRPSERAARDWLPSARGRTCARISFSSSSNVVPGRAARGRSTTGSRPAAGRQEDTVDAGAPAAPPRACPGAPASCSGHRASGRPELLDVHLVTRVIDDEPLHQVGELAHVARPGVLLERAPRGVE